MDTIIQILAKPIKIKEISIYNFMSLDEPLFIVILFEINEEEIKKLLFKEVKNLNIDSTCYGCCEKSRIIIDDVTELQWEDIFYRIDINEDIMTFYCKTIELLNT